MSKSNNGEKVFEIDSHIIKQYDVLKRLGKGAYGIVWKAVDKRSQKTVAVKKIFDAFRNQTDAQRTFREIMFLLSFSNHDNIIRLKGLHKANNDRDIYLVFEYMESDLHNVIKRGILKNIHKVFIMYQLFKAIKYIHSGNVIHRDLKPSNILLNSQCHCKIADFGLARSVTQIGEGDGEVGSDPALTDYVATRWYRAPEILIASKRYTKGIDMWSLGCIFGEMLLGKPLFPGTSTINQIERIISVLPKPTEEDILSVGGGYGSSLLEQRPTSPHRSLEQLLPNSSNEALNLIENLIVFNPTHRFTAVECLEHPYVANFHKESNEPERGSKVIPWLSDDIQLSVDEYRNKLYAMMDSKNKKHRHMSKSRVRRLSDNTKKEHVEQVTNAIAKKSFHASCDDLRKEKSKFDVKDVIAKEKRGKSNYDHYSSKVHGEVKVPPPIQTKSCFNYNNNQRVVKLPRTIQPDPINISLQKKKSKMCVIPTKPKYLSSSMQYELPETPIIAIKSTVNQSLGSSKKSNQMFPKIQKKNLTKVANVTKYFVSSNDLNSRNLSQNIVMQNYLNESATDSRMDYHYNCDESVTQHSNEALLKKSKKHFSETQVSKLNDYAKKNVEQTRHEHFNLPKRINCNVKCASGMETQCRFYYPERSSVSMNDFKFNYATIEAKDYRNMLNKILRWTIK